MSNNSSGQVSLTTQSHFCQNLQAWVTNGQFCLTTTSCNLKPDQDKLIKFFHSWRQYSSHLQWVRLISVHGGGPYQQSLNRPVWERDYYYCHVNFKVWDRVTITTLWSLPIGEKHGQIDCPWFMFSHKQSGLQKDNSSITEENFDKFNAKYKRVWSLLLHISESVTHHFC